MSTVNTVHHTDLVAYDVVIRDYSDEEKDMVRVWVKKGNKVKKIKHTPEHPYLSGQTINIKIG